jgi:hypothetical protein
METNIISLASQYLTPEILAKIASTLGLDQSVIGKACSAAIPALFGHFANLAATPEGARKLHGAVTQQNTDILGNLSNAIGGQGSTDSGVSALRSLLGGSSLSALTGALGSFAGFRQGAASSLLGMLSPIVMAILGKQTAEQGLNSSGLAQLLASQKDQISNAMPSGFADMLQSSTPDTGARTFRRPPNSSTTGERPGSWGAMPWIVPAIAAGLFAWWFIGNRPTNVAEQTRPQEVQIQEIVAVGGVDLKASARKAVDNVNTTLEEIKDGNSAQAALPKLQDAGTELDNVIKLSGQLPEAGKKAVGGVVAGSQSATTQLFDKVLAIPGVKEVAKPQIDSLRAKLDTLSKNQARL